MKRLRRVDWILVLIVDAGFVAWGAMAAAWPDYLLGPGGTAILPAGYEGFTRSSWSELVSKSPMTARYYRRAIYRDPLFWSGIVRGLSLESRMKTANRVAGSLSLAFSLIL
jgi:hypothetical protein